VRAEIFIPTYRGSAWLPHTLDALGEGWRRCCTVIDNASSDGTAELLSSGYPEVSVLRLEANRGFGGAINAAVERSGAELLVLLNDDVVCEPAAVDALVRCFADSRTGMAAGVLVGARTHEVESAGIACDPALAAHDLHDGDDAALVGPTGGLAAYRRAAFDEVGGFDPGFFAYYEDVDLALRLAAAAWRPALAPQARGLHAGSASVGWRSLEKARLVGESRGRIIRKYGVCAQPRALPWVALELLGALVAAVELRSLEPLSSRVRGYRACDSREPYPSRLQVGRASLVAANWERLRRRFRRAAA
jgi:N-acetylglucosaminyl-diphospho-decaprenol L-rhamnosyltransferase